jgi:hypothetical protein
MAEKLLIWQYTTITPYNISLKKINITLKNKMYALLTVYCIEYVLTRNYI